VHTEDFHNAVAIQKGCVTCQAYHPIDKPLDRIEWVLKHDKAITTELNKAETNVYKLIEQLNPAEGSELDNALRRVDQTYKKVRKAVEEADQLSEYLEEK